MNNLKHKLYLVAVVFVWIVIPFGRISIAQNIETVIEGKKGGMGWTVGINNKTNRIYVPGCGGFCVIDGETHEVIDTISSRDAFEFGYGFITSMGVNSNTNRIYIASNNASQLPEQDGDFLFVLNPETKEVISTIKIRERRGSGPRIGINHGSNLIYVNTNDNKFLVMDGETNEFVKSVNIEGCVVFGEMTVNENTNRVYVTDWCKQVVNVMDGSGNIVIDTITGFDEVSDKAATINPVTNRIYIGASKQIDFATHTFEYWLYVIDGFTNKVLGRIIMENDTVWTIAVNPTTNHIFVGYKDLPIISVVDGNSNKIIKTIQINESPDDIGINPNTNFIYLIDVPHLSTTVIKDGTNQPCVASSLINGKSDNERLKSLRLFRDNLLSESLTGLGLIKLYYKHSGEVNKILDSNPELKARATEALNELIKIVMKRSIDDKLEDVIEYSTPRWLLSDIEEILKEVGLLGSDELRKMIDIAMRLKK